MGLYSWICLLYCIRRAVSYLVAKFRKVNKLCYTGIVLTDKMIITKLPLYTVDAFTILTGQSSFTGNPAAVILVPPSSSSTDRPELSTAIMQSIAAELALPETAFLVPLDSITHNTATTFALRWFTPTIEVPLCGHATLASTHVVLNEVGNPAEKIVFRTLSGELVGERGNAAGELGEGLVITLPANYPTRRMQLAETQELIEPLISVELIPSVKEIQYAEELQMLLVQLDPPISESRFKAFSPDIQTFTANATRLAQTLPLFGVIVTTLSPLGGSDNSSPDFLSRAFFPVDGEDPVTGSAHTVLGPYWSEKLEKSKLWGRQCSSRGGDIVVMVEGQVVRLLGRVLTIIEGKFNVES